MDGAHFYPAVMQKQQPLNLVIAENLTRLMADRGLSQSDLHRLTGIGQSTVSRITDTKNAGAGNPRATTLETLAEVLKVAAWKLLVPNIPIELLLSRQADAEINLIVDTYLRAPEIGRSTILRVAEMQAAALEPRARHGKSSAK